MGFSSRLCLGCGHPMLAVMATNKTNAWMRFVVVVDPDGKVVAGIFDGYGGVLGAFDPDEFGDFDNYMALAFWHRACWNVAGRPRTYDSPSPSAPDQGWFFNEGAYDIPAPTVPDTRVELTDDALDALQALADQAERGYCVEFKAPGVRCFKPLVTPEQVERGECGDHA